MSYPYILGDIPRFVFQLLKFWTALSESEITAATLARSPGTGSGKAPKHSSREELGWVAVEGKKTSISIMS